MFGVVGSGVKSNLAYWYSGSIIEPEYEPLIYPEPVYLRIRLMFWSVSHKLWEATLAVFWGNPSVLNLSSTDYGLLLVTPQTEFNTKDELIYEEPLV